MAIPAAGGRAWRGAFVHLSGKLLGAGALLLNGFGQQIGVGTEVPEPASLSLIAVGGMALMVRRRRAA